MRRGLGLAVSIALGLAGQPAGAAPQGFVQAQQAFDAHLGLDQRILTQVLLIAAGYANWVPTPRLSTHHFKALQDFQRDHGFVPNGLLTKLQLDRLIEVGGTKLGQYGFAYVRYPDRPLSIWAPVGLGMERSQTDAGLHFNAPDGHLTVHLLSLKNKSARRFYAGVLAKEAGEGGDVHYKVYLDREDWFVVSATTADGRDRYYRYHQDGPDVTGFALEWNNAVANINAERIAIIMSASLRSAMTGAPFIDPPGAPVATPAAAPVTPAPAPAPAPPKAGVSSGSGFFVSEAGHFVTNAHVVRECTDIAVKTDDGAVVKAERVAADATNDLALLKLPKTPARVAALRIGVRLGEGIEAFGFPHSDLLASAGNFTLGNVSALSGLGDDSRYLQISAPVQSGNSGGPLLDTSGNVVGVVTSKLNAMKIAVESNDLPQNVNFAIKAGTLAGFLDANRVTYKVGAPAAVPLQPADIADAARAVSGFVVCR